MPKQTYICSHCKNDVYKYKSTVSNPNNVFCNRKCYNKWMSINNTGKNNPNYGNEWNKEQRQKASKIIKKRYEDPEYRYNIGKSNRGKKLSSELIEKMHSNRKPKDYSHPHTEESKKKISKKSKEKFKDINYNKKVRKVMEERGYWIPLKDKKLIEIYYKESNWIGNMYKLIKDVNQINLFNENGIFNTKSKNKNLDGVVRDHIYSRRSGFKNKVFTKILRHPCNCQLLTNKANIKKANTGNRYEDSDHQTLEELFDKILNFEGDWKEQEIVIKLIKEYKNGKRWELKKCS